MVFNEEKLHKDLETDKASAPESSVKQVAKKKVTFRSVLEDVCGEEGSSSGGGSVEAQEQAQGNTEGTSEATGNESDLDAEDVNEKSENLGSYMLAQSQKNNKATIQV